MRGIIYQKHKVGGVILTIAVCDNDISVVNRINELISLLCNLTGKKHNVESYSVAFDLVKDIKEGKSFDIIYLDSEMSNIVKEIREFDSSAIIIYLSTYKSYTIGAEVAFDFIIKPIQDEQFKDVFLRAYNEISNERFFFEYRFNKTLHRIPVNSIMYFQSYKRIINLITLDNSYNFYGKINEIEEYFQGVNANFWRIHQSYLVNGRYIWKVNYKSIVLINGVELNISENRQKKIREKYLKQYGTKE